MGSAHPALLITILISSSVATVKNTAAPALIVAALLALAGCSASAETATDPSDGVLHVVASTNVYANIAETVGGERVDATAIIDSVAHDPHSYEATARDRLALRDADLVIQNGGGYDSFMDAVLDDTPVPVVTAVTFAEGFPAEAHTDADHDHRANVNEHVWFDPHTMMLLADDLARELALLDPDGAETFTDNAQAFAEQLQPTMQRIDDLRTEFEGQNVFLTEPLAGQLAEAAGLTDIAPAGFAAAVEEGRDVAPATLLAALDTLDSPDVRAVLSNTQTGGGETDRIEQAARDQNIAVVSFSEILPPDATYTSWLDDAVTRLAEALQP